MTYPTVQMPRIEEVVPGVDPENPTDAEDRAWNAHCTALALEALKGSQYVRTHYPFDLPDGSSDDTITLDEDGQIVVVDAGVQ